MNVSHRFPGSKTLWGRPKNYVFALTDVSLEMLPGDILGVVGESGCGKSTLGRCAVGLIHPQNGEIHWAGIRTNSMEPDTYKRLRFDYQMVFQNPYASLNPRQNVKSMLREAFGLVAARMDDRENREIKIQELIEKTGFFEAIYKSIPINFPEDSGKGWPWPGFWP